MGIQVQCAKRFHVVIPAEIFALCKFASQASKIDYYHCQVHLRCNGYYVGIIQAHCWQCPISNQDTGLQELFRKKNSNWRQYVHVSIPGACVSVFSRMSMDCNVEFGKTHFMLALRSGGRGSCGWSVANEWGRRNDEVRGINGVRAWRSSCDTFVVVLGAVLSLVPQLRSTEVTLSSVCNFRRHISFINSNIMLCVCGHRCVSPRKLRRVRQLLLRLVPFTNRMAVTRILSNKSTVIHIYFCCVRKHYWDH